MVRIHKSSIFFIFSLILLSACAQTSTETVNEEKIAGMPNPASVYCEEQGGTLEIRTESDGGAYGICIFADSSECEEWAFFRDECKPGDSISDQSLEDNPEPISEIGEPVGARQAIIEYLRKQHTIEAPSNWEENDIGLEGTTTIRFVSHPWTIELNPTDDSNDSLIFNIVVSQVSTGFYWEGTIAANGDIQEWSVIPPATILNPEAARDAVVVYVTLTYELKPPEIWIEQTVEQNIPGSMRMYFTADAWSAEVVFAPAAPIVPSYQLIIDNVEAMLHWEGVISARGEISESQATLE